MMKYLDAEYYVALLSAAGFYGASHQKPMVFQVVSKKNRRNYCLVNFFTLANNS
ncbi:MAG: hypothetical protein KIT27_06885 [Legionellales bacterium]|nr:hypothetical protein [Legionellales bacterium]